MGEIETPHTTAASGHAAGVDTAAPCAREGVSKTHATAMHPGVAPDGATVGGDDGRAPIQAKTHVCAVCAPHLAVVYHPEVWLEDTRTELG